MWRFRTSSTSLKKIEGDGLTLAGNLVRDRWRGRGRRVGQAHRYLAEIGIGGFLVLIVVLWPALAPLSFEISVGGGWVLPRD